MVSSSNNKVDGEEIVVTDDGNFIIDLHFTRAIKDAPKMAEEIKNTVGVVDHGLFCGLTTAVIIAGSDGISVKAEKKLINKELRVSFAECEYIKGEKDYPALIQHCDNSLGRLVQSSLVVQEELAEEKDRLLGEVNANNFEDYFRAALDGFATLMTKGYVDFTEIRFDGKD